MSPRRYSFSEVINGRNYRIEICSMNNDRWRAEVVTQYGGPTALMPFYGTSPESAREGLTTWLANINKPSELTR